MITILGSQLLAMVALLVLLCLPGWALSRLVQLHLYVPTVLAPAAQAALGLGVWTVALIPSLTFGWPVAVTVAVHGVLTLLLAAAAWRRERVRGYAKRPTDSLSGWTIAALALAVLVAAALRTRMAFDTLFHLGLVRRLLELPDPTFGSVDRIVGSGVNPAYAVPAWQSLLAGVSFVTQLDPAVVLEAAAAVAVLFAACAAAALGRVVTNTVAGEIAAASVYAWMRVTFPRRELEGDGVAYAALPGNVTLDVLLVVILVTALLVLQQRTTATAQRRPLLLLGAVATALFVLLHANYVVYLALLGFGTALWLLVAGPWTRDVRVRLLRAAGMVAVPGLLVFAALLPVLVLLENFGSPIELRIDYHVVDVAGVTIMRPGHLYDWFAAPGLLAMLVLPWGAWRARGAARALIAGGSLTLLAVALVPPLPDLLGSSGSMTLGLRLPRPFGILLIAAAAVAIPDLIARVRTLATRVTARRGRLLGRLTRLTPFAAVLALSFAYGYPRARLEPPEYGWNWPTLVAAGGLLAVLVAAIRGRRSDAAARTPDGSDPTLSTSARTTGLVCLALAICMLPSGITSLRRGAWQSRELVASWRADDLRCYDGVQAQLRRLPGGSVLLADPVSGYGAQALAPVRIPADFKVWNGATDSSSLDARIELLRDLFDSASPDAARSALTTLTERYDAQYLLVAAGEVEPPLGSDLGTFDAVGLRALLHRGDVDALRLAAGAGRQRADTPDDERAACDFELWRLTDGDSG